MLRKESVEPKVSVYTEANRFRSVENAVKDIMLQNLNLRQIAKEEAFIKNAYENLSEANHEVGNPVRLHLPGTPAHGKEGKITKLHPDGNATVKLDAGASTTVPKTALKSPTKQKSNEPDVVKKIRQKHGEGKVIKAKDGMGGWTHISKGEEDGAPVEIHHHYDSNGRHVGTITVDR